MRYLFLSCVFGSQLKRPSDYEAFHFLSCVFGSQSHHRAIH